LIKPSTSSLWFPIAFESYRKYNVSEPFFSCTFRHNRIIQETAHLSTAIGKHSPPFLLQAGVLHR